jgi:lysophospholipase L1-like esterase
MRSILQFSPGALRGTGCCKFSCENFYAPRHSSSASCCSTRPAALDLIIHCRMPGANVELINAGLASETLSGTSEKQHPWPRPDVHERAARAIEKAKPTMVIWCYGMNDGIYAPPDAGRMEKFQAGTRDLSKLSRAAGARVVILTPPPFDPLSYKGTLAPDGFVEYGFKTPWQHYDRTLAGYAAWLRDTEEKLADEIVDLHTPLRSVIAEWHKADPKWSSGDGIHPVAAIHWLMAGLIAEALGVPGAVAEIAPGEGDAQGGWTLNVRAAPPVAAPEGTPPGFFTAGGFQKMANRFELTLPVSPSAAMRLKSGDRLLGIVRRDELARGLDLTRFPALALNRDANAALPLALERHRILSAAWREHIGHTRPDTDRTALPLDQAKAAAAKIDEKLNALLSVREESLRLEPVVP